MSSKQLAILHQQTCLDICQQHLDRYGNERDTFSESPLVIHHCEPESNGSHPQSPNKKNLESQPSTRKLMLTVFWDSLQRC
jgi:hypothetical protein